MIGVSFGAACVAQGISPWLACAMSMLVFAGGSQFAVLGVVATGGGPLLALGSGLALNARYFGMSAALPAMWRGGVWRRALAAHLLVDESAALAFDEPDETRARQVYWGAGTVLFGAWNLGTAVGAMSGAVVANPETLGLDAALPASLLALVAPQLCSSERWAVALTAAAVALAGSAFLPAGTPILLGGAAAFALRGAK